MFDSQLRNIRRNFFMRHTATKKKERERDNLSLLPMMECSGRCSAYQLYYNWDSCTFIDSLNRYFDYRNLSESPNNEMHCKIVYRLYQLRLDWRCVQSSSVLNQKKNMLIVFINAVSLYHYRWLVRIRLELGGWRGSRSRGFVSFISAAICFCLYYLHKVFFFSNPQNGMMPDQWCL